jgi:hypothetical protein
MQKIVLFISLTGIYFLGFGITLFFTMIFNRKVLIETSKDDTTSWIEAAGYDADMNDALRQS